MLASLRILSLFVALAVPFDRTISAGEAQNAFNEAVKHYRAGKFKEAIAAYDRAIKASPEASEAYNNRGLAYHKLGQVGNAVKDYDQAVKLNPQFTDALYNRGNALLTQKQYERA